MPAKRESSYVKLVVDAIEFRMAFEEMLRRLPERPLAELLEHSWPDVNVVDLATDVMLAIKNTEKRIALGADAPREMRFLRTAVDRIFLAECRKVLRAKRAAARPKKVARTQAARERRAR